MKFARLRLEKEKTTFQAHRKQKPNKGRRGVEGRFVVAMGSV